MSVHCHAYTHIQCEQYNTREHGVHVILQESPNTMGNYTVSNSFIISVDALQSIYFICKAYQKGVQTVTYFVCSMGLFPQCFRVPEYSLLAMQFLPILREHSQMLIYIVGSFCALFCTEGVLGNPLFSVCLFSSLMLFLMKCRHVTMRSSDLRYHRLLDASQLQKC